MRRKLMTIFAAAAFLTAICLLEQYAVHRITGDAIQRMREAAEDIRAGRLEEAKQKTHVLDKAWDERAKLLETMVDHSATDDVRYALSRLLAALEGKDRAAALIYAGELEGSIEHMYERQELSLENVL